MSKMDVQSCASEPVGAVLQADGRPWDRDRRAELKRRFKAGELDSLTFEAAVFRTGGNRNHVRFRDGEMHAFAASFSGLPFLRDHAVGDLDARDGTVLESKLVGDEFRQTINLTTDRGIGAFLDGVIDRFSIGWYFDGVTCSVCGHDYLDYRECQHLRGRRYRLGDGGPEVVCELIFERPEGKETSAVNAPAVNGTGIIGMLSELVVEKESKMAEEEITYAQGGSPGKVLDGKASQGVYLPDGSLSQPQSNGNPVQDAREMMDDVHALREEVRKERVEQLISGSKLSEAGKEAVRLACVDKQPSEVQAYIDAQLKVEAEVLQKEIVRGIRPVTEGQMTTAKDTFQAALNWMFGSNKDPLPVPSLRRISDLYQMITGDFNWYGTFNPEFSQLAAASTTTLAGMVVDALNRVVQMHFDNLATYRWFESIVSVVPHSGSTHDVNLIMVDGMGNLPTVGEGAAYTEAVVGDSRESMAFNKRGHYVGITLEAIRKSDIARIQAIPREMVKSSVRTRSAAIAGIFTQAGGTGPTLAQDNTVLFHSNHGNVDTTPFDTAGWAEIRQDIWKQVIPGSGNPLGLWPTFALVPIELYDFALETFGYGAGDVGRPAVIGSDAGVQVPNPYAESRMGDPRPVPIAVPEWTDDDDWAAIVDPRLHPVISMAYANSPQGGSHPLPEIFEATSETQGLMFTNDTLPVKVRDWWAFGVSTYVGVAKRNV